MKENEKSKKKCKKKENTQMGIKTQLAHITLILNRLLQNI